MVGRRETRLVNLETKAARAAGTRIFVNEPENPEVYRSEGEVFTRAQVDEFERLNPNTQVVVISFRDKDA